MGLEETTRDLKRLLSTLRDSQRLTGCGTKIEGLYVVKYFNLSATPCTGTPRDSWRLLGTSKYSQRLSDTPRDFQGLLGVFWGSKEILGTKKILTRKSY